MSGHHEAQLRGLHGLARWWMGRIGRSWVQGMHGRDPDNQDRAECRPGHSLQTAASWTTCSVACGIRSRAGWKLATDPGWT